MDSFAALIKKRKADHRTDKEQTTSIGGGSRAKYVRRGQFHKLREAAYDEEQQKIKAAAQKKLDEKRALEALLSPRAKKSRNELLSPRSRNELTELKAITNGGEIGLTGSGKKKPEDEKLLGDAEVIARLRGYGEPKTLFGETTRTRQERLRRVELQQVGGLQDDDLLLQDGHGVRNIFLDHTHRIQEHDSEDEADDKADKKEERRNNKKTDGAKKEKRALGKGLTGERVGKKDKEGKVKKKKELTPSMKIYKFYKRLLRMWATVLSERSAAIKRSVKGKRATKCQKQCKDYMRPLFKKLKKKTVPAQILDHLSKMVDWCIVKEYVKAHSIYMDLAIGRAPWPIGATSVGIHARAARERIQSSKIAHVMNDEEARKYVTSIKRLMTFCQTQYPTDPSKMVLS